MKDSNKQQERNSLGPEKGRTASSELEDRSKQFSLWILQAYGKSLLDLDGLEPGNWTRWPHKILTKYVIV